MEPTPLTCPKCGASWKLVKAGKGPVACPKCKEPMGGRSTAQPVAPLPLADAAPRSPAGIAVSDVDDPGLRGGFVTRPPEPAQPRRRTGNPLLRVIVILLLLMILVPLAVIVLFAVVCAFMVAGR